MIYPHHDEISKIRKNHLDSLLKYNNEHLKKRIDAILMNEVTHRGDKRACMDADGQHKRLVELRCRRYVYTCTRISEKGEAIIEEDRLAKVIENAAVAVAQRYEIDEKEVPKCPASFKEILRYMRVVKDFLDADNRSKRAITGWDPYSGSIGARYAYDTIMSDSKQIAATKFAVSAAEIAPRLFKKIVVTHPEQVHEQHQEEEFDDWDDGFDFGDMGMENTLISFDQLGSVAATDLFKVELPKASVEEWQMLYTLLYTSAYSAGDAARKLGVIIPTDPSPADLREARLDALDVDLINEAYPELVGDYLNCGVVFDLEWLERDEADAYTVDEISKVLKAALF